MNMFKESHGVFVFAQQVDKTITNVSYELIGKAKEIAGELGTEVSAVLVGSGIKQLAQSLVEYGADRVIVIDDEELETYTVEPYTQAVAAAVGVPVVTVAGPTRIDQTRPLGNKNLVVKTEHTLSCMPCFETSLFLKCPISQKCMTSVSIQKVGDAIASQLKVVEA